MYKRFYLGGLGTLRGYRHKEYFGTEYWMSNIEYRIAFPGGELAASIFWDGAQLTNEPSFNGAEVKHTLGIAGYFGDNLHVSLAKRFDRSFDDNPRIFVRLDHSF
jgi:outer membrane protein assembly factor BamA